MWGKQLYHLRWGIEEAYKLFKVRADIESFSGMSALSVRQDFYAGIFAMNACAVLNFPIEEKVREEVSPPPTPSCSNKNRVASLLLWNKIKQFVLS